MHISEAVKSVIKASGLSGYKINEKLGKSSHFISSVCTHSKKNNSGISSNTLVDVLEVLGYQLAFVPKGEELPEGSITITKE